MGSVAGSPQSSVLPPPEQKAAYVQVMFGRIARRYDLMNRLMTLGRDRSWRRYTVSAALKSQTVSGAEKRGARTKLLDVGTGTADLLLEARKQRPSCPAVGLDVAPEMLTVAKRKLSLPKGDGVLVQGDALRLPFYGGCFDAVVTGFVLRNVTDIPAAFAEMARVTRPGGRLACLEISRPRLPFFRQLFALYFYRLVPLLGSLVTGQRAAYTYLPHSLTAFLTPEEIVAVMRGTDWREPAHRRLMLGTVALVSGTRRGEAAP